MSTSGACAQGRAAAQRDTPDRLRRAADFHAACRGCSCVCHRAQPRPSLAEQIEQARLERLASAGVDPIPPAQGTAERCRHGHARVPTNTGTRGECLTCKKEQAAAGRKRRAARV